MPIQNRDSSHVVQFMSHRNRWGVLERAGQLYNLRSAARIVPLLCSMSAKWERERSEAARAVDAILWTLLQSYGITAEQVTAVRPCLDCSLLAQVLCLRHGVP